jgi:Tol biopolymer transport system component
MPSTKRPVAAAFVAAALLCPAVQPAGAATWKYARVVTSPRVYRPSEAVLSANGQVVVQLGYTTAPDATTGQLSGPVEVVAYDLRAKKGSIVSTGIDGKPANGYSYGPTVSADGRYVAFSSSGSNLVAKDTNGSYDVFVRDLKTRRTTRVDLDDKGHELPKGAYQAALSPDGSRVAYSACVEATCGLFLRTLRTGKVVCLTLDKAGKMQNGGNPAFSATGRYVAFLAAAFSGLTDDPTDPTDYYQRVYVYDTVRGSRVRAPDDATSVQGVTTQEEHTPPVIDPTGTWVASQEISHLPLTTTVPQKRVVLANLKTGAVVRLGDAGLTTAVCCAAPPVFSADGAYVVYGVAEPDGGRHRVDALYRRALKTGATERLSGTAALCATDTACDRPYTLAVSVSRDTSRIALVTPLGEAADDTDGHIDLYLLTR